MFLHVSVSHSVHGGGAIPECIAGSIPACLAAGGCLLPGGVPARGGGGLPLTVNDSSSTAYLVLCAY